MKLLRHISLVFTDLDETLLGPDHQVGARAAAAIPALVRAGVEVVVCTGRAPETTAPVRDSLGLRYMICNNGAVVLDGARPLFDAAFPAALALELGRFFQEHGANFYMMAADGYFVSGTDDEIVRANAVRGVAPPVLAEASWARPLYKLQAIGHHASTLYDECARRFGERLRVIYHPEYLEIGPLGVNKAWGTKRLAEHLRVPAEQVLAMGDALNDLEMLAWSGLGVAMGDGAAEVRAIADFVSAPHTEDGAGLVLQSLLRAYQAG